MDLGDMVVVRKVCAYESHAPHRKCFTTTWSYLKVMKIRSQCSSTIIVGCKYLRYK